MAKTPATTIPVTRESNDRNQGEIPVILQVPQPGAVPMGTVMPIDAANDPEFNDALDEWRVARAERECLEANVKALEGALQDLRKQANVSLEREVSKRSAFEQYLDKNLNKDNPDGPFQA